MPTDVAVAPPRAGTAIPVSSTGWLLPLAIGATLATIGFRAGAVPGGQVGIDLLLAGAGWWFGSVAVAERSPLPPAAEAVHRVWPGALVALAGAVAWVMLTPDDTRDRVVRGAALGLLGGYGNWHQLAVGPFESGTTHLGSPLQHLWPWSIAAQAAAAFSLLFVAAAALAPRRSARRPHPVVIPTFIISALLTGWSVLLLVGEGSPDRLVLDSRIRAIAFFLAAGVGAAGTTSLGRTMRSIATSSWIVALGLLAAIAVIGAPDSSLWQDGAAVVSPVLAALVVTAAAPWRSRRQPNSAEARVDPCAIVVAALLVHGPVLALVSPARTDLPWSISRALGLVLVGGVAWVVALATGWLSTSPAAYERRKVLLPPVFVAGLVVLLSVTGAFHWEDTRPLTPEEIRTKSSQGNEPG